MSKILNVTMKQQEKDFWCYSAVAEAVLNYYGIKFTQEQISKCYMPPARKIMGRENDNYPQDPTPILAHYHVYNGDDGYSAFEKDNIIAAIIGSIKEDNGPVIAKVGEHFILIIGYQNNKKEFVILDPITGNVQQSINIQEFFMNGFPTRYRASNGSIPSEPDYYKVNGVIYTKQRADVKLKKKNQSFIKPSRGGKRSTRRRRGSKRRAKTVRRR